MKIGAAYPQTELAGDLEAAQRIPLALEEMGFDHMLAYDHVVAASHERGPRLTGPYTEKDPFHDPFVLFAFAAGLTRKLEFATGVIVLPQRQTVLAAKQAADLDLLSNGRLRLGVGPGWNYVEYDALGMDFHTRGRRLNEQITYLRKLWATDVLTWKGEFDQIERAGINPRPKRKIPIWAGGMSEPAYKRSTLVDGFMFAGNQPRAASGWTRIAEVRNAAGLSMQGFGGEAILSYVADPQDAADQARRWEDMGGSHVCFVSLGKGFNSIDQHLDYLDQAKQRFTG